MGGSAPSQHRGHRNPTSYERRARKMQLQMRTTRDATSPGCFSFKARQRNSHCLHAVSGRRAALCGLNPHGCKPMGSVSCIAPSVWKRKGLKAKKRKKKPKKEKKRRGWGVCCHREGMKEMDFLRLRFAAQGAFPPPPGPPATPFPAGFALKRGTGQKGRVWAGMVCMGGGGGRGGSC